MKYAYGHLNDHLQDRSARTPAAEKVIDSLRSLEIDARQVVLVGSAALALYGIKLVGTVHDFYAIDLEANRPGDVDFAVTASHLDEVGSNPSAFNLQITHDDTAPASGRVVKFDSINGKLPVDLIHRSKRFLSAAKADEMFIKRASSLLTIPDTDFKIIPPDDLATELLHRRGYDMSKRAADDYANLLSVSAPRKR